MTGSGRGRTGSPPAPAGGVGCLRLAARPGTRRLIRSGQASGPRVRDSSRTSVMKTARIARRMSLVAAVAAQPKDDSHSSKPCPPFLGITAGDEGRTRHCRSRQQLAALDEQELAREHPRLKLHVLEVGPVAQERRLAVAILEVVVDLAVAASR